MPCNCGRNKVAVTVEQAEAMRQRSELEQRMAEETNKSAEQPTPAAQIRANA